MSHETQHVSNTPPSELKRAARPAARRGTPVPVYADGVRLTIRPDVERIEEVSAPVERPQAAPGTKLPKRRRTG